MRYFYTAQQRKARGGTLYFEFQRGKFQQQHWKDDSIYLYADVFDQLQLHRTFIKALPHFDYYYVTEVSPEQYAKLKECSLANGGEIAAVITELDSWVTDCFQSETVFTICGI